MTKWYLNDATTHDFTWHHMTWFVAPSIFLVLVCTYKSMSLLDYSGIPLAFVSFSHNWIHLLWNWSPYLIHSYSTDTTPILCTRMKDWHCGPIEMSVAMEMQLHVLMLAYPWILPWCCIFDTQNMTWCMKWIVYVKVRDIYRKLLSNLLRTIVRS